MLCVCGVGGGGGGGGARGGGGGRGARYNVQATQDGGSTPPAPLYSMRVLTMVMGHAATAAIVRERPPGAGAGEVGAATGEHRRVRGSTGRRRLELMSDWMQASTGFRPPSRVAQTAATCSALPTPPPHTRDHRSHGAHAGAAVLLLQLEQRLDCFQEEKVQAGAQPQTDHSRLRALPQRAHAALRGRRVGARGGEGGKRVGRLVEGNEEGGRQREPRQRERHDGCSQIRRPHSLPTHQQLSPPTSPIIVCMVAIVPRTTPCAMSACRSVCVG